ncbi:hypothetical protein SAMN05660337_2004 [Maridesulfovibrio ferrireducens]|uniref:Uncharacterized protein n=1 Tax=Maridesulfovibrio ferrireducens TaxID=246191 RepID=A0A1G9H4F4_9BACT|nr:hypothetical protein [Maridesulfovibrio ferrireducens]SDL07847.1 hypothetical protein SAMN05660337_2004 [Maridesulfovibrio ferrireducens]
MSVSLIMTNFSAGELSPRLGGRVDLAKYSNGLAVLENMYTHPHGGASRRTGFRFIREVIGRDLMVQGCFDSADGWTIGAGWSVSDSAASCDGTQSVSTILSRDIGLIAGRTYEFGFKISNCIGGSVQIISAGAGVSNPASADGLFVSRLEAGESGLISISADVDFIGKVESVYVREIGPKVRLIPFEFSTEQAYVLEFTDKNVRIYKDSGIVVDADGEPVEVSTPYTESDLEKLRFTQSADVMYLVHPEVQPYKLSRTSHVDWTVKLVPFLSPPAEWNSEKGFPSCVTFFEERLCFAASPANPQTVWMSKSGAYENFGVSAPVVDDDACTYTLSADQVNAIRWMVSSKKLIMGTSGGEWWLSGGGSADSVTPNSVMVRRETTHGSAAIPPVVVGGIMIFLQREGKTIRELSYSFEADGYVAPDLTILAEHLTRSNTITEWAYQQSPDSIVWMIRDDGALLGLTYQREHEVVGYHRHVTEGKFRSVCVIPGVSQEELWCVVTREVEGVTRSYIERMEEQFNGEDSVSAFFVDSGLSYDQDVADTVFTGLDHLEGKKVSILADGAVRPDVVVEKGHITLASPAKVVHAGLPYTSNLKTLRIEGGSMTGTAQGSMKRISHVTVRLFQSLGLQVGYDKDNLERAPFRTSADKVGGPPSLFDGDYEVKFNRGYDRDGQIYIRQDQPLPLTVLALIPQVSVYS